MTKNYPLWIVWGLIIFGLLILVYLFRQSPRPDSPESVMATSSAFLTSIPRPTPTPHRKGEDYYKMYALDGVTYDKLARDTERYEKKIIMLTGRVLQVVEDGDEAVLRFAVDGDVQNVVILQYPGYSDHRVLADDNIRVYGTVLGRIDYKTVLGQQVTAPAMTADWVQISQPR
jgi:hypothetical protein